MSEKCDQSNLHGYSMAWTQKNPTADAFSKTVLLQ